MTLNLHNNLYRPLGNQWTHDFRPIHVFSCGSFPCANDLISQRRHALFGHVRCSHQAAPERKALHFSVTTRRLWVVSLTYGENSEVNFNMLAATNRHKNRALSLSVSLSDVWSVLTYRSAWRALWPIHGQAWIDGSFPCNSLSVSAVMSVCSL